jgi:site-specific DNA recombinase
MTRTAATPAITPKVRCAIYTRKSTEEGLEMEFNSLDAQREAGENYIASQRAEGWVALPVRYDDGGYSGGTLERPALQQLLRDIEAGQVDCIVCYKIDRLSRSLLDFAQLVEQFDRHGVTFMAVTQSFNTTTSMGRLTLNILLSFAQFEREVIGERIRDKFAASKRKGMFMGGPLMLGYDVKNRKLVINQREAALVRDIFTRFIRDRSTTKLSQELNAEGHTTKSWTTTKGKRRPGQPISKMYLYRILTNRIYLGEITHKGAVYPGEHDAIIPREQWDQVQAILAQDQHSRAGRTRLQVPSLLKGIIRCGHCDTSMGMTYTQKAGKQYRYYLCNHASKFGYATCPVKSVPAGEIEQAVVAQLRRFFTTPEMIAVTARKTQAMGDRPLPEQEVAIQLGQLDGVWDELFPAEQARLLQLMVKQVTVSEHGLDVQMHADGLYSLMDELRGDETA